MKMCFLMDLNSLHTRRWVKWFLERGHEVHVVGYEEDIKPEWAEHAKCHTITSVNDSILACLPRSSRWGRIPMFRKVIKEIDPDVVIAHYITYYGLILAFCGRYPKVLVAWGSDVLLTPNTSIFEMWVAKTAAKRASLIISVAPHLTEEIVRWGISKEKIITNLLGVDKNIFTPKGPKIETNRPTIISTRALENIYDVGTLIKAVPKIKESYPDVLVWIFGTGTQEGTLRAMVKELGLERNVLFKGHIPNKDLPVHLRSADVYVSTSLSDGASISLFEAMACETYPVITEIPANRSILKACSCGSSFRLKDCEDLANAVVSQLCEGKEGKDILRKFVLENADWNKCMTQIESSIMAMSKIGHKSV